MHSWYDLKMSKFSKKRIIWFIVVICIALGGYMIFGRTKITTQPNTTTVKRGDVIQEVSVTGRVKPTTIVDLSFEKTGRILGIYSNVGEHVSEGTLLSEVESSSAQASLMEAEARLAELKRGSRPEEIAIKEAELAKYNHDLSNTYSGILDAINDAFAKSDDALHAKMAGIFSGFKSSSYKFTYPICDGQLDLNGTTLRYEAELDVDIWRTEIASLSSYPSNSELSAAIEKTSDHLEKLKSFLEAVNRTLTIDCTVANTALDAYRINVNAARSNIITASSNINAKKQAITASALAVTKVRDELSLMKAGTASEVIAVQEARVFSAQGELRKYRVYAPISGTMTKVDATTGESSNTSKPLFSIISDTSFEIEAYVPEADIAKIKIGDAAKITLDAYGPDIFFDGKVTIINPAETIIDNVPTYKVTFHFIKNDSRIKSGMTANIDIGTASQKNVLFIPGRAVIIRNGEKFVRIIDDSGIMTETPVTLGLKGSNGSVELISGPSEGTVIVSAPIE